MKTPVTSDALNEQTAEALRLVRLVTATMAFPRGLSELRVSVHGHPIDINPVCISGYVGNAYESCFGPSLEEAMAALLAKRETPERLREQALELVKKAQEMERASKVVL